MQTIPKTKIQFSFDQSIAPAAYASSGDTVRFICQDCYAGQIDCDGKPFSDLDMTRNNPVTGPLFIHGAEPGDMLKIEVKEINVAPHGTMCVRTGCGVYEVNGCHCRMFNISDGEILFDSGIRIPIRPMIGVIGVCPKDAAISTQSPGEHGGNLDNRELGVGSTLFLRVNVPGALLSVGDLHAVQGDGETAICAMEVSGSAALQITVIKGAILPTPFLVTERACYTMAAHEDLNQCSVLAAQKMQQWLIDNYHLSDAQAAMLLSLQGNLRITQVVNPQKGCMMELPLEVINQLKQL